MGRTGGTSRCSPNAYCCHLFRWIDSESDMECNTKAINLHRISYSRHEWTPRAVKDGHREAIRAGPPLWSSPGLEWRCYLWPSTVRRVIPDSNPKSLIVFWIRLRFTGSDTYWRSVGSVEQSVHSLCLVVRHLFFAQRSCCQTLSTKQSLLIFIDISVRCVRRLSSALSLLSGSLRVSSDAFPSLRVRRCLSDP